MGPALEKRRRGIEYLDAVTMLLNRIRNSHPTAGLYDAAELHWWWAQAERSTDDVDQLFWFDDRGRPEAAVIVTSFGDVTQLDPLVLPDVLPHWVEHIMQRGLSHAADLGFDAVCLEVDNDDSVLRSVLTDRGFASDGSEFVEAWLPAQARPAISTLAAGYRLSDRSCSLSRPHHMINARRDYNDPEPRLNQTSLYRPDLDLVAYDDAGSVAAYGLFWYDPTTGVGVVEPMRTEDEHQNRGLARHVLTSGIDRLVLAGAKRIKICFDPANAAARHLYLGVGFKVDRCNEIFVGPTTN